MLHFIYTTEENPGSSSENLGSQVGQSNGNVDDSQGHIIKSKRLADPPNVPHSIRSANVGPGDGVGVSSHQMQRRGDNGLGNHSDALSGYSNLPSKVGIDANAAEDTP